jgi:hypothetical protein
MPGSHLKGRTLRVIALIGETSTFRGCKYQLDKTQKKLLTYYYYRCTPPYNEYYKKFSFQEPVMKFLMETGAFIPLPAYDDLGRRLLLERVCQLVPIENIGEHCKLITWIFMQIMYHDKQAQVRGANE